MHLLASRNVPQTKEYVMDSNQDNELPQEKRKIVNFIRVRHDRENPFLIVNKQSINDRRLSLEAVGLLARLLCHRDDWSINVSQLIKQNGCGKDKMSRILKELIKYGYAYREVIRERGKYFAANWYIFESPKNEEEIKELVPRAEKPPAADPTSADPKLISNKSTMRKKEETNIEGVAAPPPHVSVSPSKKEKPKPEKMILYREHVHLKEGEYEKLCDQIGKEYVDHWIEELDDYISLHGKKYQNHAKAIQVWHKRSLKKGDLPLLGATVENQMEGLKTRISTNRSMCYQLEEKLRRKFTSTILIQASNESILVVNKHKDVQKEYRYDKYSNQQLRSNLTKDLSTCFPHDKISLLETSGDG